MAVSVVKLSPDGTLTPYPDAAWNGWRNAAPLDPATHFVCVQSVAFDGHGMLWVLDAAAAANAFELAGGRKLVGIDRATKTVARVIPLGFGVMPQGSQANDMRFTPDGAHGVMTHSGQVGALLAIDLRTGRVRRRLSGHPSMHMKNGVKIAVEGKPVVTADGRGPSFAADGIAIDPRGERVYWQALTGRTQYRLPMSVALDQAATPEQVAAAVERLGACPIADGYCFSAAGVLCTTSPESNAIRRRQPDGSFATVVRDDRLRWPDTMAEGCDGELLVTASPIPDMTHYSPMQMGRPVATALFRFKPRGKDRGTSPPGPAIRPNRANGRWRRRGRVTRLGT